MTFCRGDGGCEICDPPIRRDPDEIEDNGTPENPGNKRNSWYNWRYKNGP